VGSFLAATADDNVDATADSFLTATAEVDATADNFLPATADDDVDATAGNFLTATADDDVDGTTDSSFLTATFDLSTEDVDATAATLTLSLPAAASTFLGRPRGFGDATDGFATSGVLIDFFRPGDFFGVATSESSEADSFFLRGVATFWPEADGPRLTSGFGVALPRGRPLPLPGLPTAAGLAVAVSDLEPIFELILTAIYT
jgi:hypothetical protein